MVELMSCDPLELRPRKNVRQWMEVGIHESRCGRKKFHHWQWQIEDLTVSIYTNLKFRTPLSSS